MLHLTGSGGRARVRGWDGGHHHGDGGVPEGAESGPAHHSRGAQREPRAVGGQPGAAQDPGDWRWIRPGCSQHQNLSRSHPGTLVKLNHSKETKPALRPPGETRAVLHADSVLSRGFDLQESLEQRGSRHPRESHLRTPGLRRPMRATSVQLFCHGCGGLVSSLPRYHCRGRLAMPTYKSSSSSKFALGRSLTWSLL